jgi:peptidyl-prolyl cis-trans isomerase C
VLATVNGEAVTSADLDEKLIETHRTMDVRERMDFDYRELLEKLIHDRLLVQEAIALDLGKGGQLEEELRGKREKLAARLYAKANFEPPDSIPRETIEDYFETYYRRVQLRQITVRTEEEARRLIERIQQGASMDSLARIVSLDPKHVMGGLHNHKYWKDVEPLIRDFSRNLQVGQISQPFPYRDLYSFVRLERKDPAVAEEFEAHERGIRNFFLADKREKAWKEFVAELRNEYAVVVDEAIVQELAADSGSADWDAGIDRVVIRDAAGREVTETELRREIGHQSIGKSSFDYDELLQEALDARVEHLVLLGAAEKAGYLTHDEVERQVRREREKALISAYLDETIVPQIVFNREEFQEYYDTHQEEFQEPDQVRLGTLLVESEEEAKQVEKRLAGGADFEYLRRQFGKEETEIDESRWVSSRIFSAKIVAELEGLKIGQTTPALQVRDHWVIFKLKDRRPGRIKGLDEVDMQIREVMFQKKFNELLKEHLAILRERSNVRLNQAEIDEYFGTGM